MESQDIIAAFSFPANSIETLVLPEAVGPTKNITDIYVQVKIEVKVENWLNLNLNLNLLFQRYIFLYS